MKGDHIYAEMGNGCGRTGKVAGGGDSKKFLFIHVTRKEVRKDGKGTRLIFSF